MLTLKEFDPHKIVLVDENNKESTLYANEPDSFDRDILEDILSYDSRSTLLWNYLKRD